MMILYIDAFFSLHRLRILNENDFFHIIIPTPQTTRILSLSVYSLLFLMFRTVAKCSCCIVHRKNDHTQLITIINYDNNKRCVSEWD